MRKLATVREIKEIRPIPNADSIEVAVIDGWECVVKKSDMFSVGDLVVYVEIDSIMPDKPEYEFLRERKFRVRTIKLRKQVSQGLALPLSFIPSTKSFKLGDDVTDIMGITKYDLQEKQEQAALQDKIKNSKNPLVKFLMRFPIFRPFFIKKKRGGFPTWIHKTDEERVQNLTKLFEIERDNGTVFDATEKIDGQSATYYLRKKPLGGYEFGVCSRNIHLKKPDNSSYWTVARQYGIERVLRLLIAGHDKIVLQGEIIGTGIQGNKYHIDGYEFRAFNLIRTDGKCNYMTMQAALGHNGIKCVDWLGCAQLPETIPELVEKAKGKSLLYDTEREGLVLRNYEKNISFKVINPDFLLNEKD